MAIYPWQAPQWQLLLGYRRQQRMPHALLLHGEADTGKRAFARTLAEALLCSSKDEYACGTCHSCRLLQAGNHPDLVVIEPAEPGKAIKVDAIRAYIEQASLTPQIARSRVCILAPADAMNQSAANSLLKTLEEPAQENHLLLVSDRPAQLPATIRSRCQKVAFPRPAADEALAWLRQQDAETDWEALLDCGNGLPLRVLRFAGGEQARRYSELQNEFAGLLRQDASPAVLAGAWSTVDSHELLEWLFRWTLDLLRFSCAGHAAMQERGLSQAMADLRQSPDSVKLVALLGRIMSLGQGLEKRNLNYRMQLEALLISYTELNA
ncbi:MAG: DNA polymerase III subunit delta' [Gammaproteobacteria bacterium]|jgi:DNA polymerase III subunit delta'